MTRFRGLLTCFFLCFALVSCDTMPTQEAALDDVAAMRGGGGGGKLKIKGLESLVTMHNGQIVSASYFAGTSANDLKHVRSVTKSVVALLVGIAIEEGHMGGLDDTIGDHLAGTANLNDKAGITVGQLLTMTGGFQWSEIGGNEFGIWINAQDQVQYVLDKPLSHTPGTYYTYNTGATHILGVMVAEATGMSLDAFAATHLFGPLGITQSAWDADKQGNPYGGHGIQLKPVDMVKLGQLVLDDGAYNGTQVVPTTWMQQVQTVQWPLNFVYGDLTDVDYGYLWYLDHGNADEVVLAWGYGGQFVYTVPALDLIVATTAKWAVNANKKGPARTGNFGSHRKRNST
ncbi:MAG: serine hydrolase [Bacteroidota bacterium]